MNRPRGFPILNCDCCNPPWPLYVENVGADWLTNEPGMTGTWHLRGLRRNHVPGLLPDKDKGEVKTRALTEEEEAQAIPHDDLMTRITGNCPRCNKFVDIRFEEPAGLCRPANFTLAQNEWERAELNAILLHYLFGGLKVDVLTPGVSIEHPGRFDGNFKPYCDRYVAYGYPNLGGKFHKEPNSG